MIRGLKEAEEAVMKVEWNLKSKVMEEYAELMVMILVKVKVKESFLI